MTHVCATGAAHKALATHRGATRPTPRKAIDAIVSCKVKKAQSRVCLTLFEGPFARTVLKFDVKKRALKVALAHSYRKI